MSSKTWMGMWTDKHHVCLEFRIKVESNESLHMKKKKKKMAQDIKWSEHILVWCDGEKWSRQRFDRHVKDLIDIVLIVFHTTLFHPSPHGLESLQASQNNILYH